MTVIDIPLTARRSSRSASPASEPLVPTEPLSQQELSLVCTVAREKLLFKKSVQVRAIFRRKDDLNGGRQTVMGKLRKDGLDLWAVWEDKPSKEYQFPHPDLDYYELNIIEDRELPPALIENSSQLLTDETHQLGSRNEAAGMQEVIGGRTGAAPISEALREGRLLDPNALNAYEPLTYEPWINAADDDGFRTRDLIRELRDAPEFGLRVNQFYHDRTFIKQQERLFNSVFCKWIIFARLIPNWNEGVYLEMGRGIVQTLRDAYWRARRVDVDLVHQKMEKDIRPDDKFYHHVNDQLVERQKQYARVQSFSAPPSMQVSRPNQFPPRHNAYPPRRNLLCFGCRSPDHIWRNCPKRFQQDFRGRVAGPAHSSKSF